MKRWKNNIWTGVLAGIILPPLAFYVFCFFVFPNENAWDLLQGYALRKVLTHVISLAAIANLGLFFLLLRFNLDIAARGVLGATLLYAFVVVSIKFL